MNTFVNCCDKGKEIACHCLLPGGFFNFPIQATGTSYPRILSCNQVHISSNCTVFSIENQARCCHSTETSPNEGKSSNLQASGGGGKPYLNVAVTPK